MFGIGKKDTKHEEENEVEVEKPVKKDGPMVELLNKSQTPPSVDDLIEGTVIGIDKAAVYVDLPPFGTGIIYGREFIQARDIIRKINIGDSVAGKVVAIDNAEGYIEISLKEARQAIIWSEAEDAIRDKKIFEIGRAHV